MGLRPTGKGALVVTAGPVGNGADGRFGRLKVGLCIMWPAFAVTVSLLSPPQRGSDAHRASYLWVGLSLSPFPSRNRPIFSQLGHCGHVKGDSAAPLNGTKVHVKKLYLFGIIFKSFVGFDFKTCMFIM